MRSLIIIFLIAAAAGRAQDTSEVNDLSPDVCFTDDGVGFSELENPYDAKKWRVLVGFDGRVSASLGRVVSFSGFRLGVTFKNRHKFGLGIYSFKSPIIFEDLNPGTEASTDSSDVYFALSYASLFYEYLYFRNMRWEIGAAVHYSNSTVTVQYTDTADVLVDYESGRVKVPLLEVSTVADYRLFRWLSVKAGIGYRFMFHKEDFFSKGFQSGVLKFGVGIKLGDMWHAMNKKKEKHAVYNEYWSLYRCTEKNR